MARNKDDKYSFHFLVEWDDGQQVQVSLDGQYKKDVPWYQVHAENDDADMITLEGISDNYEKF